MWARPQASGESGEVEFAVDVTPVYDGARALLLARLNDGAPSGAAQADDVSLVAVAPTEGRLKLGETELYLSGELEIPDETGKKFKVDKKVRIDSQVHKNGPDGQPISTINLKVKDLTG